MTKRIYTLLVLLFCATFTFAQSSLDVPSYEGSTGFQDEEKADESDNYFPPKPKHGTEIGLSLGHHFIHGDVYARPGWGVGLHVRRAINYSMSWRVQGVYGNNQGLDTRASAFGRSGIQLPNSVWRNDGAGPYSPNSRLYRNYKTTTGWVSGHFVANLSNILFHKKSNKWNLYVFGGPSLLYYKGKVNIFNADGGQYSDGGNPGMAMAANVGDVGYFNRDKFKDIKNNILDDSYETELVYFDAVGGGEEVPGFTSHNFLRSRDASLMIGVDFGAGLARKLSKRVNIAIEHQAMISLNDNLDGYVQGRNVDVPHFTTLKLNVNLNPKEGVEPLYWVNPLQAPVEDIARLKRDQFVLKDTDGDGVIDELDEEADTPEGYAVDTKGRSLDSDGDGIKDGEDTEPYTPYHLVGDVDDRGVAEPVKECEDCGLTRDQIIALGKDQKWGAVTNTTVTGGRTGCGEWFLPMIHFDLDKYSLKSEAKAQLHHIAQVMKQCPETCIVAVGHTDRLNNNAYNQKLSYNRAKTAVDYLVQVYGISPSRLKVNYGGEETPLVDTNASSYINRRVEFKVCKGEMDMGSPSGNAGFGSGSSSGFGTSGSAPVKY